MTNSDVEQAKNIATNLSSLLQDSRRSEEVVGRVAEAIEGVSRAWSGSSLGYQALVYYADLDAPRPGAHFSSEWGLMGSFSPGTSGDWREYSAEDIKSAIWKQADATDLGEALSWAKDCQGVLEKSRNLLKSLLSMAGKRASDEYLDELAAKIDEVGVISVRNAAIAHLPSGHMISRDPVAVSQGLRVAPHQEILAQVMHLRSTENAIEQLKSLAEYAAGHLARVSPEPGTPESNRGEKVFIGHGRSSDWRKLKDFVQDRLSLPWDEFNRVPVAGQTNIGRLAQMLDEAAVAFLIMTKEDVTLDGESRARENVVHEVGLFQGRLGFGRAIVLIEEGCNEFSNINGLGQIRYPSGSIEAAFEEIRRVLEREGIVPPSGS